MVLISSAENPASYSFVANSIYPDEGMLEFATKLYDAGFSAEEIKTMTIHNPRKLLGKE